MRKSCMLERDKTMQPDEITTRINAPSTAYPPASEVDDSPANRKGLLPGIALLIAAVAFDRFGLEVGGFNIRLELAVGALLAGWYVFRGGLQALREVGLVEWCLLGWLAVNAVSSLLFSPQPVASLKLTLLLAGLLVLYPVGLMLFRSSQAISWAATMWVVMGIAVSLVALSVALLYIQFGWTEGITLEGNVQGDLFTITPKVHSTLWEPNILGSYSLVVGMLAFGLGCAPAFRSSRLRWLPMVGVACAFCGVMLSMTRTAWAVGLVLLVVASGAALWLRVVNWRRLFTIFVLPALVGIGIGLAIGYSMPTASIQFTGALTQEQIDEVLDRVIRRDSGMSGGATQGSAIDDRLSGLGDTSQVSSFVGRERIYRLALQGWLERPLLGWGTGSFAFYDTGQDRWIPNLELHILFDTGIVGFLLLVVAASVTVWRGVRALRGPHPHKWDTTRYIVFGLLLGALGLFLTYQLTEGSWLGFSWVFFALLVSATRYTSNED